MLRRSGGGDFVSLVCCSFESATGESKLDVCPGDSVATESSHGLPPGALGSSVRIWTTSRIVGRSTACSSTQSIAT